MNSIDRIDSFVDNCFAPLRGHTGIDRAFWWASEIADMSMGWHLVNAGLTAIDPDRMPAALRLAAALGFESALVNGAIKPLFGRERPAERSDTDLLTRRPKTSSFPSGHASSAATAAVLLSDEMPRLTALWWTIAAFVGLSRVHNSQHHASDVAAGFVVGGILGRGIATLWPLGTRGSSR